MKNIILGTLMLLSLTIRAQEKVNIEMLEQSEHAIDSLADAAYLFHNCEAQMKFKNNGVFVVMRYKDRIKFYNDKAEDYAKYEVVVRGSGGDRERVKSIKAISYNLVNGKIEKTKMDKKSIFEEKTTDGVKIIRWAVPNVKEGTIIDVEYEFSTPNFYQLPTWYFQNYIPTDHSTYSLKMPTMVNMTNVSNGSISLKMEKKAFRSNVESEELILSADNIPSIEDDKYVLNIEDYRSSITYVLHSIVVPGDRPKYFNSDWAKISKMINDSDGFRDIIRKDYGELDQVMEDIDALPDENKVKFIYDYVRDNITWDESYGISAPDGLKDVILEQKGSAGEMNLLLLNLLHRAGIQAYPVVTKYRFNGLLNQLNPSATELNYALTAIPNGVNQYTFLDPTSKYVPMGKLPLRAINITGLLIKENTGFPVTIENPNKFISQTVQELELDLEEMALVGEGTDRRKDYAATKYRIEYDNIEKDEDEQDIGEGEDEDDEDADEEEDEEEDDDDEVEEDDDEEEEKENEFNVLEVENLRNIDEPITIKYNLKMYSPIKKIGDQIFIDAMLDFGIDENPFLTETREYPIFYNSKVNIRRIMNIKVPEGYNVESIPLKVSTRLPGKAATFLYSVTQLGDKLTVNYGLTFNKETILPSEYPALKQFYDLMVEKHNEKIILSKDKITAGGE